MSITVDTINLRFNVKPDYNQQQLQKLADDLKQSQRETANTRKEIDKFTQKIISMQDELSTLKYRRHELQQQPSLSKKEEKELARLNVTINKTQLELDGARNHMAELSATHTEQVQKMQDMEKQMQQETRSANLYAMSLNQLRERQRDLNAILNNLSPNNEMYQQLKDELDGVNQRMKELRKEGLKLHDDMDLTEMSVKELTERLTALNESFRDCDPNDDDFERYATEIKRTQKRLDELNAALKEADKEELKFHNDVKLSDLTIEQLNERLHALQTAFRTCDPNSDEFKVYAEKIEETKDRIEDLRKTAENTKSSLKTFLENFNRFAWAFQFAKQGIDKVVQWADQYVQAFAKMDEAMTDVMKYTGQTKAEVEHMNEAFQQMTTRTAREELNALAGAGGRLGITAERDIVGFVSAADKINVALGDDLGQGAIDQIGKLTMVFGEDKKKGLEGAMLATGSAINVLGASSSANTGFITEFTSSMAGMAVNANIAQTDIMGYASALSQAGIEGQTASGVFAQLITKMFTDPAKFAKAAGLEVKTFTQTLKTDANQAILQFLEGLKAKGGFESLAPALKSLKMQGTQAVPVISSLINKMDELKTAQKTAREAYDEGTSIIDEFNNANSSAAAKLDIAKKAMNDEAAALGQKLMPIVEGSIKTGTMGLKIISSAISFTYEHRTSLITLAATIATITTLWQSHAIWQAVVNGWNKTLTIGNKALTASMVLLRSAGVALQATWALLTKGMQGYIVVMRAARMASLTNPWIALATVLTVVGVAIYGMAKAWQNSNQALRQQTPAYRAAIAHAKDMQDISKRVSSETAKEISVIQHLTTVIRSNAYSVDERRAAIRRLESIVPGYHASIDKEGRLIEQNTNKLTEYVKQLKNAAKAQAYADKMAEIAQEQLNNDLQLSRKQNNLKHVDAELDRGRRTGEYASDVKIRYNRTTNSYDEVEQNERLTKKLEERKKQENAVNEALKKREELNRRQQQLETQMQKDGIVSEVTVSGTRQTQAMPPISATPSNEETDKERNARLKKLREEHREQEALLKAQYEENLLIEKQSWQDRLLTDEEYHQRQFTYEQEYLENLAQLRRKYGASESDIQEVVNQEIDLVIKRANYQREQQQRQMNEELQMTQMSYQADLIAIEQQMWNHEFTTEEEYQNKKLEAEIDYQLRRKAIIEQYGGDATEAQNALDQAQLQAARDNSERKAKELEMLFGGRNQDGSKAPKMSTAEKLQALDDNAEILGWKKKEEMKTQILQEEEQKRQDIQQAAMDATQQLLNSASQLFQAMQQRETAAIDAKYKKLINTAKKQGKDTTKLEEQQEAEKQAVQKKYAQKQFLITVLQIVANTAQGISKTIAELGMPLAIPFVAAAAAAGAAQLAAAKMASDQAAGLYEGGYSDDYQEGYTKKGDPKKQAGVIPVHQNEFVANHRAVANPQVRPVLDVIDRHQRMGDISVLNSTRLLEEAYGQGRYRGGYTRSTGSGESRDNSFDTEDSPSTINLPSSTVAILERIEQNTARSLTVRSLREEIAHEEHLESNARR